MNRCFYCKCWDVPAGPIAAGIVEFYPCRQPQTDELHWNDGPTNTVLTQGNFLTGPDFGCINFEAKTESPGEEHAVNLTGAAPCR